MARRKDRPKKRRLAIRKRASPGASPGTLVADPCERPASKLRVISYGRDRLEERFVEGADALPEIVGKLPVTWIDVDGVGDLKLVEDLGRVLALHPLALEDTINLYQRPKVEEYAENLFVVVRMASLTDHINTEQLSLFVGKNYVLTFQGEHPGDCLDPVRRRLQQEHGRLRVSGPDYLAYAVIDAVIDNYFPVLDDFGMQLEKLEDELVAAPVAYAPSQIQLAKQDLLLLRRTLLPLRDVVGALSREDNRFISAETRIFLRDCADHAVQLMDVVNTYRELAGGLMELYLSGVNNRMNEVMKFLTLVSTIFIPLTFVVGIYGMNFDPARSKWNMPEIEWEYGYPAVMAFMAVTAMTLVYYFKRKGWLETPK